MNELIKSVYNVYGLTRAIDSCLEQLKTQDDYDLFREAIEPGGMLQALVKAAAHAADKNAIAEIEHYIEVEQFQDSIHWEDEQVL